MCAQAYDGLELSALDISDFSVGVDNTPPIVSGRLSRAEGNAVWYLTSVNLTLSGSDALSGLASLLFQIGAGTRVSYTGPFVISESGRHVLSVVAMDVAGNSYEEALPIQKDTVEPQVVVAFPCRGGGCQRGRLDLLLEWI